MTLDGTLEYIGVIAIRRGELARLRLVALAELRIAQGRWVVAAEWLGFVAEHEVYPSSRMTAAQRLLDRLRDQVSPEELTAAVAHGRDLILEEIVNDLLPTL